MERKREITKNLLAESLKKLMLKGSFDKITIKMITDESGVIRPTFYNYFQDKYEVIEWLLEQEIFNEAIALLENGQDKEAIQSIFIKMDNDRAYYQKAFEITGQNGFDEIITRCIKDFITTFIKKHEVKFDTYPDLCSEQIFVEFQAVTIVSGMRLWFTGRGKRLNAEEAMEFYMFLMGHSILDMVQNK